MGKVGDLIVRLKLQYEDYKKGLKDASAKTNGFGGTLGKMKGIALGVWAAIGTAVLKVAADVVKSTNQMQDKWEMFTNKAKAAWSGFIKTLANGDWKNFTKNIKTAAMVSQYYTEAMQATTEVTNSIAIQKAQMAEELAALEITGRDATKSLKERAEAVQQYINKVKPIYDQEIKRLDDLRKANMAVAGAGVWSIAEMSTPDMMAAVEKFLVEYGKDTKYNTLGNKTIAEAIGEYLEGDKNVSGMSESEWNEWNELGKKINSLSKQLFPKVDTQFLLKIAKNYETNLDDKQVQELVNSIVNYNAAIGAKDSDLKKFYTLLNSLKEQMNKEANKQKENPLEEFNTKIEKELKDFKIIDPASLFTAPDIFDDDWVERNVDNLDAVIDPLVEKTQEIQSLVEQMNDAINNGITQSISSGIQAISDALFKLEGADSSSILQAFMQPIASTMIQLGEMLVAEGVAIEAFKTSLSSLNGYQAIAAGIALITLGAALSSGIRSLGTGATTRSTSTESAGSSSSDYSTYQQEIIIHVVGEIQGDKIVISGQKALNKWSR